MGSTRDFPSLLPLLSSHWGGLYELLGDRSISIGYLLGRLQEVREILRVRANTQDPNFMTCLMPCGRGCHSPIPPTLVPATSIPGLPSLRTRGNHVWKINIPILGYRRSWKESVVYRSYSCMDPYQPTLSLHTQLLQQLLHQFYPLETGN